jgi:hypothetical protein
MLFPDKLNYMGYPGKNLNIAKRTISVDWRHLLNELFHEETYV